MSGLSERFADQWGEAPTAWNHRKSMALEAALFEIDALTARVAELEAALRALNAEVAAGGEALVIVEDGLNRLHDVVDKHCEPRRRP